MECDSCTTCCTLLVVPELNKAAGQECEHDSGIGCDIYEDRPDSCRALSCAYHMVDNANIAMRPDKSGVVFEKVFDDLMFGTVNPNGYKSDLLNGQVEFFLKEGINTVLAKNGVTKIFNLDGVDPESLMIRIKEIQ